MGQGCRLGAGVHPVRPAHTTRAVCRRQVPHVVDRRQLKLRCELFQEPWPISIQWKWGWGVVQALEGPADAPQSSETLPSTTTLRQRARSARKKRCVSSGGAIAKRKPSLASLAR